MTRPAAPSPLYIAETGSARGPNPVAPQTRLTEGSRWICYSGRTVFGWRGRTWTTQGRCRQVHMMSATGARGSTISNYKHFYNVNKHVRYDKTSVVMSFVQ